MSTSRKILAAHSTPVGRAEYAVTVARRALEAAEAELEATLDANPLPADWDVWNAGEGNGWAVSREHGSVVVGIGYASRAQAYGVALRTLAAD
jgi:hypothetical protein